MSSSSAKAKLDERKALKKLSKKEKYLSTSAKVLSNNNNKSSKSTSNAAAAGAAESAKKPKLTALDEAYANTGSNGNDLFAAGRRLFKILFDQEEEEGGGLEPCVIERENSKFYSEWISKEELLKAINEESISKDDLTLWRITNGAIEKRPFESGTFKSVLDAGCTLKVSEPQQYFPKLWRMLSLFEAYWGQPASASIMYKTAERSTPVTPLKFDCRDAFVMILEGSIEWNVWEPSDDEAFPTLPLAASPLLAREETSELNQSLSKQTLQAGDHIYIPRGYIYEANASSEGLILIVHRHSAEMTWGDLIEQSLLRALQVARESNVMLRTTLPRDFASFLGVQHAGSALEEGESEGGTKRAIYELQALKLIKSSVMKNLNVDTGADDVAAHFLDARLRPALEDEPDEEEETEEPDELSFEPSKLTLSSEVALRVRDCARICVENGLAVVRHSMKNAHRRQGRDERNIEFDLDDAPTVEAAISDPDGPFAIGSLPEVLLEEGEEPEEFGGRVRVVSVLINEGILRLVKY